MIQRKYWPLLLFVSVFGLMLFLIPVCTDAITITSVGDSLDLGSRSPEEVAINIINWVLGILAIIAVVIIIYAGIVWMTARGNPDRIEKAKKILISALIGLIIILASWGIVWYILNKLIDATGNGNIGGECSVASDCGDGQQCCYPGRICAANCGGFPGDTNFYVVSTWPRNMSENVFLCTAVSVRFSKPFNKATVSPETYKLQIYGGAGNGNSCSANKNCASALCENTVCIGDTVQGVIKFGPGETTKYADMLLNTDLEMNTTYKATVEGSYDGVRALDGTVLSTDNIGKYTWTFNTGEDTDVVPPNVKENGSSPFPTDESVDACLNTPIYTQFSEAMLPSSFNDEVAVNLADNTNFDNVLKLKNWDFGGLFDVFMTRPGEQLNAYDDYYVRLFGGTADENYFDAPLDMCGNPLDGDRDGDIDTEGSPIDDFISSNDTELPNDVPWHFETGETVDCYPEIESFNPTAGYYAKDLDPIGPGTEDVGSVGWISIYGKYLIPEPEVLFYDNVWSGRTIESCFNQNYTVGPPNNNPIDGTEYIEGMCLISASVGQIDIKIPPRSKGIDEPLMVSVAGEISEPSAQGFTVESPHIEYTDPSSGGVGQYVTIGGENFGDEEGDVWFRRRDGGTTVVQFKGDSPSNPECTDNWSNKEIITVVPAGFELDDMVEIQVVSSIDKWSNPRRFIINDKVGPGLCLIDPLCHENAGNTSRLVGDKFGNIPESIYGVTYAIQYIYGDNPDQSFESTSDTGLPNGRYFVRVEKEKNGETLRSNGRTYSIPCSKSPKVKNHADCSGGEPEQTYYPSPSPRPNSTNTCLDASLSAVFEIPIQGLAKMDQATLNNDNIKFYKCNVGGTYNAADCEGNEIALAFTFHNKSGTIGFKSDLATGTLEKNTWYKVAVDSAVSSTDGVEMDSDYNWHFRTQIDDSQCPVQSVSVGALEDVNQNEITDGNVFINSIPSQQLFEAIPRGPDCQLLNGAGYTFEWESTKIAIATIVGSTYQQTAIIPESAADGLTEIKATTQEKTGKASLVVDSAFCTTDEECEIRCHDSECDEETFRCTPIITGMCPADGPVGQWTTISGCMLGWKKGEVTFSGNLADYPDSNICGQTWRPNQIIAQVPTIEVGKYNVEIAFDFPYATNPQCVDGASTCNDVGELCCLVDGKCSLDDKPYCVENGIRCDSGTARCTKELSVGAGEFAVNNDPLGPMLCRVEPTAAKEGEIVVIRGINLGESDGTGSTCDKNPTRGCEEGEEGECSNCTDDLWCKDYTNNGPCISISKKVCNKDNSRSCLTNNDCLIGTPPSNIENLGPCDEIPINVCEEDESLLCENNEDCYSITKDEGPCVGSSPASGNEATFFDDTYIIANRINGLYNNWSSDRVSMKVPAGALTGNPSICANNSFDISDAGLLVQKGISVSNPLAFAVACNTGADCSGSGCCQNGQCVEAGECKDPTPGEPCIHNCLEATAAAPGCDIDGNVTCEKDTLATCSTEYACMSALPYCDIDSNVVCQTGMGEPACTVAVAPCDDGVPVCYPKSDYSCISGTGDCLCCCDPESDDPYNAWGLLCTSDVEPCDGEQRGLFCGCSVGYCENDLGKTCKTNGDCPNETGPCVEVGPNNQLCNYGTGNKLGCGTDDCCHGRPIIIDKIPDINTDVCPNTKLQLVFSQRMDLQSLIYGEVEVDEVLPTIKILADGEFRSGKIVAYDQTYQSGKKLTHVDFLLDAMLPKGANVEMFVSRDVKSIWGIPMGDEPVEGDDDYQYSGDNYVDGNYNFVFVTSLEICTVDSAYVEPNEYIFTDPNVYATGASLVDYGDFPTVFISAALSDSGQPLASYPSYSWNWKWSPKEGKEDIAWTIHPKNDLDVLEEYYMANAQDYMRYVHDSNQDGRINVKATASDIGGGDLKPCKENDPCPGNLVCNEVAGGFDWGLDSYYGVCVDDENKFPLCQGNGDCYGDNNTCQSLGTEDGIEIVGAGVYPGKCLGDSLAGISLINVFLCENPWPVPVNNDLSNYKFFPDSEQGRPDWPMVNSNYNFQTMYCLDTGLPNLDLSVKKTVNLPDTEMKTLVMYFLTQAHDDSEIIGIRVFANPENLSAADWFTTYVKNGGSYSQKTVDGFDAIETGNSTYVSASNIDSDGAGPIKKIYSNIYLISSTTGSDTLQIYRQLVDNFTFHSDLDDLEDKEKMLRDTRRLMDLGDMKTRLVDYYLTTGSYNFPNFETGAYLNHYTNSIWNSWSTLGNILGKNYSDPINSMYSLPLDDEDVQAESCFDMSFSGPFTSSGQESSLTCLADYGFERLEDVPASRKCGGEDDETVCCPDGQECLTSNIVTSRVDPVEKCLGDAFEYGELADVPSEQICGIGDDPECCLEGEVCQQFEEESGLIVPKCVVEETKQECFETNLIAAIKTDQLDDNNAPICCNPTSGQFLEEECVQCVYQIGDVVYDDQVACWSVDSKRHILPAEKSNIYLYHTKEANQKAELFVNLEFPYDDKKYSWGDVFSQYYLGDTSYYDPCSEEDTNNSECRSFNYKVVVEVRDEKRIYDLSLIRSALEQYNNTNGHYPMLYPTQQMIISNKANWDDLAQALVNYINPLPKDPLNVCNNIGPLLNNNYCYSYSWSVDGQKYDLYAQLENQENPSVCKYSCSIAHVGDWTGGGQEEQTWCKTTECDLTDYPYNFSQYIITDH